MLLYIVKQNGRMLFGTGTLATAYEFLMEKLVGKIWLTTTPETGDTLVAVVLATGGMLTLETV